QPVKLLFAQNMSTSTSLATTVRQELNRLFLNAVITEKEFGDLLAYISDNPDEIPELEDSLKYGNDNVKAIYLKNRLNRLTGMFSYIERIQDLEYENFFLRISNTQSSASVYRFVRAHGDFQLWEIEEDTDINPLRGAGDDVFINNHDPPAQGSSEVDVTQPFCKDVVSEINEILNGMRLSNLLVLGDGGGRVRDNVFPDIIIGRSDFYKELTENPPDLSKGLGWEVKNDLSNGSKVTEGKGQLIKYARAYLTANPPLTNVFYGCLTDGKLWLFVKIQFVLDNPNNPI
ncbi:12202_t:CDS:2, partial [Funneliformis geosporum]